MACHPEPHASLLDDPIKVGDRVAYTLGYATAMYGGAWVDRQSGLHAVTGTEASTHGTVTAIGEPFDFCATVRWDDGREQTLHAKSLVRVQVITLDVARYQREATSFWGYQA
ncbi:hypothetical protein [Sphingomonas yabuuchiae]|uniref:hypothetical protein n=1 Tax=Sphingomonas yabuuchiae TaxID=172044 RepID=UPI003D96758B